MSDLDSRLDGFRDLVPEEDIEALRDMCIAAEDPHSPQAKAIERSMALEEEVRRVSAIWERGRRPQAMEHDDP
jgi:hypothetical protein